jgi:hypothetical protein
MCQLVSRTISAAGGLRHPAIEQLHLSHAIYDCSRNTNLRIPHATLECPMAPIHALILSTEQTSNDHRKNYRYSDMIPHAHPSSCQPRPRHGQGPPLRLAAMGSDSFCSHPSCTAPITRISRQSILSHPGCISTVGRNMR